MKYEVSTNDCFLEKVAEIIDNSNLSGAVVILPNRRSCRELKKYCHQNAVAISDLFLLENERIVLSLVSLLKQEKSNIPFSTLYELAVSLCSLLNELILNKINIKQLSTTVPAELHKYWIHTIEMIETIMKVPEIVESIKHVYQKLDTFLHVNKCIVTVGISGINYYAKQLLKRADENGIAITADFCYKKNSINFMEFNSIFSEGLGIALTIKMAILEQKSVLMISLDQNLTEIVKTELKHWNIIADDSRGTLFFKTSNGILISLVLDMMESCYECYSVISVLKMNPTFCAIALEIELFFRKLQAVPSNFFIAFTLYSKDNMDTQFLSMIERFRAISLNSDGIRSFSEWLDICCKFASEINSESVAELREIVSYSDLPVKITRQEFAVFIKNHVLSQPIRTAEGYTNNVVILGAIEAQLLEADCIIVAGVNDESWSKSIEKDDFWMAQSMLKYFGMQSAEMKNEFLQNVFARLVHKKNVLVTRSTLVGGIQQQRYRYFDRISENLEIIEATWLKEILADMKNTPPCETIIFETPSPEISLRPQHFWVSDIDLLLGNPYAFYAKKILKLHELTHINELKNIRGNYTHSILEEFVKNDQLTWDIFMHIATKVLKNMWINSADFGLWFFRLNKIYDFIANNMDATKCYTEIFGNCLIKVSEDRSIKVSCKADRIDVDECGNITIVDYKTGAAPAVSHVLAGEKIQLPIELIIAQNGGFGLKETEVKDLCYWELKHQNGEGKIIHITKNKEEIPLLRATTLENLKNLAQKYNIRGEGYDVNVNSPYEKPYMHLARVKEWSNV
ncbi:MAG: PD-(D/E)XK nuclease family protein [Holosporaceae bacterium]|jgi:ATP-dependent helicase/nuclease subunit B|nr:PD-(D/E)XK nuclease family protein [Holosporaceae bacterium]